MQKCEEKKKKVTLTQRCIFFAAKVQFSFWLLQESIIGVSKTGSALPSTSFKCILTTALQPPRRWCICLNCICRGGGTIFALASRTQKARAKRAEKWTFLDFRHFGYSPQKFGFKFLKTSSVLNTRGYWL